MFDPIAGTSTQRSHAEDKSLRERGHSADKNSSEHTTFIAPMSTNKEEDNESQEFGGKSSGRIM